MLRKRVITAAVLIPLVLVILFFFSPLVFIGLASLVVLAAAWEWTNLMGLQRIGARILYLLIILFIQFNISFAALMLLLQSDISFEMLVRSILIVAFAWWLFALLSVWLYPRANSWWRQSAWCRGVMGVMVLLPCWVALIFIRAQADGSYMILFLFLLIWGADIAAYFAGKKFGKHKLAPKVSPGKSIEGVIAALLCTVLLTVLAFWLSKQPRAMWPWALLLSLVTVVFSIVGDLFESMLKRNVDIKDSGTLLPGHGGLLDRIDSLTAAAPIFALGALLLGAYL